MSRASAQAPETSAAETQARAAFERGRSLYDHGSFVQAAEAFEEAYRLSGRDALLYNIYLAHRDANQPEQAAQALRDYLARVQNIENREQLEARLVALEQGLAREREAKRRDAEAAQAKPEPAVAPAPSESAPATSSRGGRFVSGIALTAVGGAMALASIGTGVMARARESDLEEACPMRVCRDPGLRADRESGVRLARATDGLLFGGVAVAVVGGVLLLLDRKSERAARGGAEARGRTPLAQRTAVAASCSSKACEVAANVRF